MCGTQAGSLPKRSPRGMEGSFSAQLPHSMNLSMDFNGD